MVVFRSRRGVLRTATVLGTSALGGCVFDPGGGPEAGALVLSNEDDESHTVTLAVTKTSENSDDAGGRYDGASTPATPVWRREDVFSIDGGERRRESEYLDEPGAYLVEATLATGRGAAEWVGLYETADGDVGSDAIYVTIRESGAVNIYGTHGD